MSLAKTKLITKSAIDSPPKWCRIMDAAESAKNALQCVLEAEKGDTLVIFCDDEKMEVGEAFAAGALKLGLQTRLTKLKTEKNVIRKEIPKNVTEILANPPKIYINLFRGIREETPFRIKLTQMEEKGRKSRLGHCPGVTLDMLTEGALALKVEEHRQMQGFAHRLIQRLTNAVKMEVTNPSGTKLSLSIEGRPFFTDTIIDKKTMKWMNLPTGEAIVAPVEDSLEGVLVCDMAVGGVGPVQTPIKLTVAKGMVQKSECKDAQLLKKVEDSLNTDENSRIVGEFAFGINPKARFIDEFLEAEKILGTIHIAFGNNSDYPNGKNPSKNHLDLLMSKPTVKVTRRDGSSDNVLVKGVFA